MSLGLMLANCLTSPNAGGFGFFKRPITSVAVTGDSITDQGGSGLYTITAHGFWGQWRIHSGSAWDPCPNGSSLSFATSGGTVSTIVANHLAAIVASSADTVVDASGINDAIQNTTRATTLAKKAEMWEACLAAGKQVIALAVIPIPLAYSGNGAGVISARCASLNADLEALAANYEGVFYVNHKEAYEATPGSGLCIGNAANTSDNLHPNDLGASLLGRGMVQPIQDFGFRYGIDPWALSDDLRTPNGDFALGSGPPTGYQLFNPTNGSNGTQSMVTAGGFRKWRFQMVKGTSTAAWSVANFNTNTSPTADTVCDVIAGIEVISGAIDQYQLTLNTSGASSQTIDMSASALAVLTPSDGPIVLRPMKRLQASAVTLSHPGLQLRASTADTVVEVTMATVRAYP